MTRRDDPGDRAIWEQLTEAQRLTLMSVCVRDGMTCWRAGVKKPTIAALRGCGLISPLDGVPGLTALGERVKAIGVARGYGDRC